MNPMMGPTGFNIARRCVCLIIIFYRRIWTAEEDEAIRAMVIKFGTKSWALIAENLQSEFEISGRSGKQCRERWHNHLGDIFLRFLILIAF
jgi:hypothetical protein